MRLQIPSLFEGHVTALTFLEPDAVPGMGPCPWAGERVKAMQASYKGPTSASSFPVKAAMPSSARSLDSHTNCHAACSTSGLHASLPCLHSHIAVGATN